MSTSAVIVGGKGPGDNVGALRPLFFPFPIASAKSVPPPLFIEVKPLSKQGHVHIIPLKLNNYYTARSCYPAHSAQAISVYAPVIPITQIPTNPVPTDANGLTPAQIEFAHSLYNRSIPFPMSPG